MGPQTSLFSIPHVRTPFLLFYFGTSFLVPHLQEQTLTTFSNQTVTSSIYEQENAHLPLPADKIFKISASFNNQATRNKPKIRSTSLGSYVIILTIYGYFTLAEISIQILPKIKNQSPAINSKIFKKKVKQISSSKCSCPNPDLLNWMQSMKCSNYLKFHENQLSHDFQQFAESKIDLDLINDQMQIWKNGPGHSYAVCRYVVQDNQIYRDCAGQHVGFNMFSDEYLTTLARMVKLLDVEFIQNLGDWPLSNNRLKKSLNGKILPIVSWCGSEDTYDMVLPTYDYTRNVMQGNTFSDIFNYLESNDKIFENRLSQKLSKAIWRGRDSRKERLELAELSRQNPADLDAGITAFFFFPEDENLKTARVPMSDFSKYQMILNIDGTVAAYRMPYLLAMSSLILKVDSGYYEHFYAGLQGDSVDQISAKTNFIKIEKNLSDLLPTIQRIKQEIATNQEKYEIYENMAYNTRLKALKLLEPMPILCYHVEFFNRYSKLQNRPVQIHPGMEKIESVDKTFANACVGCQKKFDDLKDEL